MYHEYRGLPGENSKSGKVEVKPSAENDERTVLLGIALKYSGLLQML